MTHAEALVYASAFVEHVTTRRDQGKTREEAAEEAVVKAWAMVETLRHAQGDPGTYSIDMLAEFRAFGEKGGDYAQD